MNRRQLLMSALSVAALSASPLAFAGVSSKRRRAMLSESWKRAAEAGEPLLVLVLPDTELFWERGRRLGMWLNNATDADLAPLGRVELACATLAELDKLVPGTAQASGAWMVLVRVDQPTPTWRSVVVPDVPEHAKQEDFEDFAYQAQRKSQKKLTWTELEDMWHARKKDAGLLPLEAQLLSFRSSIGRVLASEGLVPGRKQEGPMAQSARSRWVKRAPPGAHWASSWGCGTHVEPNPGDDEDELTVMVGCGMGRVAAYEARFLHFWDVARG